MSIVTNGGSGRVKIILDELAAIFLLSCEERIPDEIIEVAAASG